MDVEVAKMVKKAAISHEKGFLRNLFLIGKEGQIEFRDKFEKSVRIEVIGLIINSVQLIMSHNPQKLEKTHHHWEMYKAPVISVLELTKLIGLLP